MKVGAIDTEALRRDRDQLFAEAVQNYRDGGQWWPNAAFEATHIKPQQEARFEADAWEKMIEKHLASATKVTITEVARERLHLDTPKIGTADQGRIADILERLGWMRLPKDWKGNRYRSRSKSLCPISQMAGFRFRLILLKYLGCGWRSMPMRPLSRLFMRAGEPS